MSKQAKKRKWEFISHIKASPNVDVTLEDFKFSISAETNDNGTPSILYDDVMDKAYERIFKRFPEDEFPCAYVESIEVVFDGRAYPVIRESDKKVLAKMKREKKHQRILVLPDAEYYVIDFNTAVENEIYDKLSKVGLIDRTKIKKDSKEFREITKLLSKTLKCDFTKNTQKGSTRDYDS